MVVVAPNAFKGSMTPRQAAEAIAEGLRRGRPGLEVELVPLSDGGDGFLEALTAALGLERRAVVVRGPLHAPVGATFGIQPGRVAVVETAAACGMALLGAAELDPLAASTGGVGELLAEARQAGVARLLVGVGGSASTEGGTGMARALGYRFLDAAGSELPEGGGALERLDRIDSSAFDTGWLLLPVEVACDVDNPLVGPHGASRTYAPQKGATPEQVERLERGLHRLAEVVRRDLGHDAAAAPGAGAAGGLAFGLAAFLGGRLRPGAATVIDATGLEARFQGAAMLVTGEGRLDGQSLHGKATATAGQLARRHGLWVVALVGGVAEGWEAGLGVAFDSVRVVTPEGLALEDAIARGPELLAAAAAELGAGL